MEWKKDIHLLWAFPTSSSLWLSASNPIPSSLILFSKNVIRKSPFGLSIAPFSSCVGSATQSYIIKSLGFSLALFSQTHLSSSVLRRAARVLSIRVADDCLYACLSVALAVYSVQVKHALCSPPQLSASQLLIKLGLAESKTSVTSAKPPVYPNLFGTYSHPRSSDNPCFVTPLCVSYRCAPCVWMRCRETWQNGGIWHPGNETLAGISGVKQTLL